MNHFIKLPDGTIINVAHVRRVEQTDSEYKRDGRRVSVTDINGVKHVDSGNKIYAYFESIAQEL
jgi:hypothetical protein